SLPAADRNVSRCREACVRGSRAVRGSGMGQFARLLAGWPCAGCRRGGKPHRGRQEQPRPGERRAVVGRGYRAVSPAFGRTRPGYPSASRPRVGLWDVAAEKELPPLEGHQGAITSLSFSPDGKLLASASNDTTVLLWDATRLRKAHPPEAAQLKSEE